MNEFKWYSIFNLLLTKLTIMKKILLSSFFSFLAITMFAATITVTPADYEAVYSSAADGDVLLLDAGTYANTLEFPVGKAITLKKLETAASTPVLTFSWTFTVAPTAGSSLVLDGLEISLNADYYMVFATASIVDKLTFKNCTIGNINRCLIRATNADIAMNELTIENNIIKDCGAGGYCLVWFRSPLNTYTVKNNTMYNYGGEGFYLANNNVQTHAFTFNMVNNTIYKSGKDGDAYAWCVIGIDYGAASTYNISNNIFSLPFTTADTRKTIIVPAGSGTVTCKNNLVNGFPTFSTAPASGWDLAEVYESTTNYFKDAENHDFTLDASFPYKGTDGKMLGDQRWWPGQGTNAEMFKQQPVKAYVANGFIMINSLEEIQSVEIYSISGKRMTTLSVHSNVAQINTSSFNKGIYLLKVNQNNKTAVQKISL